MAWDDILDAIGKNVKKSDDLNRATTGQMVDRIQMQANPTAQGPQLPAQTADEKEMSDQMPQAMVGAVVPGAAAVPEHIAQGFANLASNPADLQGAKALAQHVADAGYNSFHPIAQKAQSLLNRAMIYGRGQ